MTTDSSLAVLATLENLIAPGKRTRLSPFVESAQCRVLFGEWPDEQRRAESLHTILEGADARIRAIVDHWDDFVSRGKDFARNDYSAPDFLDAYLAYYFSVNVPKVQLVLLDLVRDNLLHGELAVLDVGVGTGTTATALLDFLLAWGQACALQGQPLPITGLRLLGLDRSQESLDRAQAVVKAYASALRRRIEAQTWRNQGPDTSADDILQRVHAWANEAAWQCHDLEGGLPDLGYQPNLIVAANVWNELASHGKRQFDDLLRALPARGMAILIEPGSKQAAQALMRWRRGFIDTETEFGSLGPCGQEYGGRLPDACDACWSARRESFHQSPLYRRFRELSAEKRPDKRPDDQFENELLSWSYAVIGKHVGAAPVRPVPRHSLSADPVLAGPLHLRYIGTYRKQGGTVEPVSEATSSTARDAAGADYLKVCPAGFRMSRLAIERRPGYQVPELRFGERFTLTNVEARQYGTQPIHTLVPLERDQSELLPEQPPTRAGFLATYTPAVREAIDEIAYRLFGFPGMKDFQHAILERVLAGNSIFAIAATGGGKSECFILPAMLLPGLTVVVSPLKSLMMDQYEQRIRRRYGLEGLATYINGDVHFAERQARLRRMELGYYKLVYFTPEQLEQGYVLDSLRRAHDRVGLRYLALDEAHCISHWGHDFRPSYLNITQRFAAKGLTPVRIALTATASPAVRRDICEELVVCQG
ncbi:MAG TPA: DEAD/DEAH box helicase [Thermomicrobiales bacterium]|nr:DEAD/DEAH box helicase [Thermomicrobiales bacterium]